MKMFDSGDAAFETDHAVEHDDTARVSPLVRPKRAISGTELRHRLITPEALAAIDVEEPKPILLRRLLRR
jgi:hypothetical protein